MKFDINLRIHHHNDGDISEKLDMVLRILESIQRKECTMSDALTLLTAQVQESNEVVASAILLIQGIAAQLEAAKDDPAAIAALAESLHASEQALSAAIVANTPSA